MNAYQENTMSTLSPGLPCEVPEQMQTYGKRCVLSFSLTDMDTANYSAGWQNSSISNNADSEEMLKPWIYTFASLTDGETFSTVLPSDRWLNTFAC